MNFVALRNTCTLFRDTVDTCRLQLNIIRIRRRSQEKHSRESLRRFCTLTDNHPFESSGPDLFRFGQNIDLNLIDFRHDELIRMLGQFAFGLKSKLNAQTSNKNLNFTGTVININSGWIIDGLIIARSNHRVLHGGSNFGGSG